MTRPLSLLLLLLSFAACLLSQPGCVGNSPAPIVTPSEPIRIQLLHEVPTLRSERFSNLLDFESTDDALFCNTIGGKGVIAAEQSHTGRSAFRIDPGANRFTIKLSSLMAGRPFPSEWTLVGGYFYCRHATKVTVSFDPALAGIEPREVTLAAGEWTPVFAELPVLPDQPSAPQLVFDLRSPDEPVWCDDVMLIDNFKILTGGGDDASSAVAAADVASGIMPPWTIKRHGLNYVGSAPARFNFKLLTSEASASGWVVDEANSMRARFHCAASASGPARLLTVFTDGRAFWDGQYKPMSAGAHEPELSAQHQSPAQIEVGEGMGRVDRNTPGDANNDGYNETTGTYRIAAKGPRVELHIIPTAPLLSPVLEFSGLPFGKPLITLEGRLIESSVRTSSGTLLVELPAQIDRPVTVDVRIQE